MNRTIWNEETYTYHYGRDTIYIKISDELEKEGKKNVAKRNKANNRDRD